MGLKLLELEGRRALVTGAGSGLGRQMALALAEAGAELIICGRRVDALEESAAQIRQINPAVTVIPTDITDEPQVQALRERAGQVDILVNNAGIAKLGDWTQVSLEDWRALMATNVDAPFRLCQVFAPPMMERGWGRIVNVSSIYGKVGGDPSRYPGVAWDVPAYFTSKHALHGITHYLAPRLAPHGVCINSLSPGMFPSEQTYKVLGPQVVERLIDGTPMKRLGTDDDLKAAIVFMVSPGAKFFTGQDVVVDGGWTVW